MVVLIDFLWQSARPRLSSVLTAVFVVVRKKKGNKMKEVCGLGREV